MPVSFILVVVAGAGLDAAAGSLRAWLNAERFTDLSAREVTGFFTESVTRWGHGLGYAARYEVHLQAAGKRVGRLDVRLRHRSGRGRAVSVEIDRGDKRWSVDKLAETARRGDLALWLRWSVGLVRVPVPPDVRLIRAQVIRRPVAKGPDRYTLLVGNCG